MNENQLSKKRRARRTDKEVQRLVEEFISGGMKRSEFCRLRGLSPGTLRRRLEGGLMRSYDLSTDRHQCLNGQVGIELLRARLLPEPEFSGP